MTSCGAVPEPHAARRIGDLADDLKEIIGASVNDIVPLAGGANNMVCRADTSRGRFLVKMYFSDPEDRRNRLRAEYGMLSFLWNEGVRCIPEPIAAQWVRNIGVYRFVDGTKASPGALRGEDVRSLSGLLCRMWELRRHEDAQSLPNASAACFSLRDHLDMVERRLQRLTALKGQDESDGSLHNFLVHEFRPVFSSVCGKLKRTPRFDTPITGSARTLSPSDQGFHNAIRTSDGNWVFIDFEYSGWDDPAKMLADSILQPSVPIPEEQRAVFLEDVLGKIDVANTIKRRFENIYPVVALEWCMIMLNEFLPVAVRRRRFAGEAGELGALQRQQLEKARGRLADARRAMDNMSKLMRMPAAARKLASACASDP